MTFLEAIPDHIKLLDKELRELQKAHRDINWGHECNCEFCERSGEEEDENAEERSEQLKKDIRSNRAMVKKLRDYAERMGVVLSA